MSLIEFVNSLESTDICALGNLDVEGPTCTISDWRILHWQIQDAVNPTVGNMTE